MKIHVIRGIDRHNPETGLAANVSCRERQAVSFHMIELRRYRFLVEAWRSLLDSGAPRVYFAIYN
jgi:hypothetical protein